MKMRFVISFVAVQISYPLDLQIKSYGYLKFLREVWVGWACARANEEELTTVQKFGGKEVGKRGQRGQ
jgi:hypothetical protein